jgi:hypothetical protein
LRLAGCLIVAGAAHILCASAQSSDAINGLVLAYPGFLSAVVGNELVWKDGTRMPIDDGRGPKSPAERLSRPDIKDMFADPYERGPFGHVPPQDRDPGRARNAAFFDHMYGNCRKGEVEKHLVEIAWLPSKTHQRLKVTTINGVADRLAAVSRDLDQLPSRFDPFLVPAAGTYNCRSIAGTERVSPHGYGIAIDIAPGHAHYWYWAKAGAGGTYSYRNEIPMEIVEIFEAHGFIWGGKWYHYDTMHFEYRPELLSPVRGGQ